MSFLAPAPTPKSGLGYYRQLSTLAGAHVSPIALGGASLGTAWGGNLGVDKEASFKLLDAYFDLGGNFIDTANAYNQGESEAFIGEWAESKGIRDQLFIATKYSNSTAIKDPNVQQKVLLFGNSVKSMKVSVKESLQRLRTDYIDLFYIHFWDYTTGIQEVMHALHGLVLSGKVLYLGISDTPAWIVAKANQYARDHALTPFSVYQGQWSILERSFERDIIPMARDEGIALAPWGVLGFGKIRTDEEEERRRKTGEKGRTVTSPDWERNEQEKKVSKALEEVAQQIGAKSITAVAIAYLMHKTTYVFPIIGGRKVENLVQNLESLEITLSDEQIKFLESHVPLDLGFPTNLINDEGKNVFGNAVAHIKKWPRAKPILPETN